MKSHKHTHTHNFYFFPFSLFKTTLLQIKIGIFLQEERKRRRKRCKMQQEPLSIYKPNTLAEDTLKWMRLYVLYLCSCMLQRSLIRIRTKKCVLFRTMKAREIKCKINISVCSGIGIVRVMHLCCQHLVICHHLLFWKFRSHENVEYFTFNIYMYHRARTFTRAHCVGKIRSDKNPRRQKQMIFYFRTT